MRRANWEQALSEYLAAAEGLRFDYGGAEHTTVCAFHAADAVLAMTGIDYAAPFRGKFTTAAGAARALRRYGAGTLEATIDSLFAEKPIGFAQRGDLVMQDDRVGICIGADAVFIGQEGEREGLIRIARAEWRKAWSV